MGYHPTTPVLCLQNRGGGGGDDELTASGSLWLWPLPSAGDGDLRLVAQWKDVGMGESSITLNGDQLRKAAAGVEKYWPEEAGKA